jgi:hypothetical protein
MVMLRTYLYTATHRYLEKIYQFKIHECPNSVDVLEERANTTRIRNNHIWSLRRPGVDCHARDERGGREEGGRLAFRRFVSICALGGGGEGG